MKAKETFDGKEKVMINEIKSDNMCMPLTSGKITQNTPQAGTQLPVQEEGVSVTNHLSKLVDMLSSSSDAHIADESARVMDMKRRVQSNEYSVDLDTLSTKLLNSGVLRTMGG